MHFLRTQWNHKPRTPNPHLVDHEYCKSRPIPSISLDKEVVSSGVASATLAARGWTGLESELTLPEPHDPFLMKDMDRAVAIILDVLEDDGRIMIHGDYDCDGLTATAIMARVLTTVCPEDRLLLHIPNRITEGYGLAEEGISRCLDEGVDLLITVDCGIRSVDEVARLKQAGVKVVVTDHHEPGEVIPEADAVLNPHRSDCSYPCLDLSGAGVAWKLAQALASAAKSKILGLQLNSSLQKEIIALAALGTLADQMLLLNENRWLARNGLEALKDGAVSGLQVLFRQLKLDVRRLTSTDLVFSVAPKLNAAGRLGSESVGLALLLERIVDTGTHPLASEPSKGTFATEMVAAELMTLNGERRSLERKAVREARLQLSHSQNLEDQPVIVVAGDSWHVGVLGIVAARLAEMYNKPVLVLTHAENGAELPTRSSEVLLKGSGRSVADIDLLALLTECSDLLETFGGHAQAVGVGLRADRLDALRSGLADAWQRMTERERMSEDPHSESLEATMVRDEGAKQYNFDLELSPHTWTMIETRAIEQLEPFGSGMEEPLYRSNGLRVIESRQLGKDGHHLRLKLATGNGGGIDAICFGKGELAPLIQSGDTIDAVYYLGINYWRGRESVQLNIQDIKIPAIEEFEPAPPAVPTKDCLRRLWPALSQLLGEHESLVDPEVLTAHLSNMLTCPYSINEVLLSIKIYAESGLLHLTELGAERFLLRQTPLTERVSLEVSETYQMIRAKGGSDL